MNVNTAVSACARTSTAALSTVTPVTTGAVASTDEAVTWKSASLSGFPPKLTQPPHRAVWSQARACQW